MARLLLLSLVVALAAAAPDAVAPNEAAEYDAKPLSFLHDLAERVFGRALEETTLSTKAEGVTLWHAARKFFTIKEKIKASKASSGTTGTAAPAPPIAPMPKTFGIDYKHMVTWYCAKPENSAKELCTFKKATEGTEKPKAPPKMADNLAAVRAYCTSSDGSKSSLCIGAKVRSTASATAQASVKPMGASKAAGAKKAGAKKADKKLKVKA